MIKYKWLGATIIGTYAFSFLIDFIADYEPNWFTVPTVVFAFVGWGWLLVTTLEKLSDD